MKNSKFQVGQKVFISTYSKPASEATVTKVGRKYVTAGGYEFDLAKRTPKLGRFGRIETVEEHYESIVRGDLTRQLMAYGLTQSGARSLSVEKLQKILNIMTEPGQ